MYIKKLHTAAFGKFIEKEWQLSKGFNLFFGKNESGKTTLQWFIKGMLYGFPKGRKRLKDGTLPPLKRYKPWSGSDYKGYMEYELSDGRSYRIIRNFERQTVKIQSMDTFEDITHTFEADKKGGILFAEQHLGLDETLFEQTVCVRQMQSKVDSSGKKVLAEKLMNMSQSGLEEISLKKAEQALKSSLLDKVGTDKSTKRPLDIVEESIKRLYEKRDLLCSKHESLLETQKYLDEVCRKEKEINFKFSQLLKAEEIIKLRIRQKEEEKNLNKLESIRAEMGHIKESLMGLETKILGLKKEKGELDKYSNISKDERDQVLILWNDIKKSEEDIKDILSEINRLEEAKKKQEKVYQELETFQNMDKEEYEKLDEIFFANENELEFLKNKKSQEIEKVLERAEKNKKKVAAAASALFFSGIGLFIVSLVYHNEWLLKFLVLPVFITALAAAVFAKRLRVEFKKLKVDTEAVNIEIQNKLNDIEKKIKIKEDLMIRAGVDNTADFLRLKAFFEESKRKLKDIDLRIREAKEKLESKRNLIESYKNELKKFLLKVDILENNSLEIEKVHIEAFKRNAEKFMRLMPDLNHIQERIKETKAAWENQIKFAQEILNCGIESIEELSDKIIDLKHAISNIKKEIDEIKKANLDDESISELSTKKFEDILDVQSKIESDINNLNEEKEQLKLKKKEYETQLNNMPMSDELQKIEEEISLLEERKKYLKKLGKSIEIAISVLKDSSLEVQKNFTPRLNEKMGKILSKITGGKYTEIKANENLMLNTAIADWEEIVSVHMLSAGTIDQVYLALRMASADIISKNREKLPFIFDEVFSQYDDERTVAALKYLDEVSRLQQILFFTCKKREIELVKSVIAPERLNMIEL